MIKKKSIPKKLEKKILEIAEKVDYKTQIDQWDGDHIRVWTDKRAIVDFKPVTKDIFKAETVVEFGIQSHDNEKANAMFDEANQIFSGSDCEVRMMESDRPQIESSDITISCKANRKFKVDDFDTPEIFAKEIDELINNTKRENKDDVRTILDIDEQSASDIDE